MKQILKMGLIFSFLAIIFISCREDSDGSSGSFGTEVCVEIGSDCIIADHTIVDQYINIPEEYINIVKTWMVDAAGESHSGAYWEGMQNLESLNAAYQAQTFVSSIPNITNTALRIGRHAATGEEDFWTTTDAVDSIKTLIRTQHEANNPFHVMFLAWCWDMTHVNKSASVDPVYGCHWYGRTYVTVDHMTDNGAWGLDDEDSLITGNSLSLQTYLNVIDNYNKYCQQNGYITKVIFSTGPVDGSQNTGTNGFTGEEGYQRYIKHEAIRNHVKEGCGRILFDYADILAYSDSGERRMVDWTSPYNSITYSFPAIHESNAENYSGATFPNTSGHIGGDGAVRIAKAMWWLLARMAGWDGN